MWELAVDEKMGDTFLSLHMYSCSRPDRLLQHLAHSSQALQS